MSALVFSEFSSSLGFRRLCAKPKAERGLVEHLASMHGAQEFISSPENKKREMAGRGDLGLPRGRVQAECYSVVAGWWRPSSFLLQPNTGEK